LKTPGRKRCILTQRCILEKTLELLEENGYAELTIEGIAARAGVGKTTIYRWWPNKAGVVMDAFLSSTSHKIPFLDTGSVREDIRLHMRRFVKVLNSPAGRAIAALIAGGRMDEVLAESFRSGFLSARRSEAKQVLLRGIERGEIRADVNPEVALDTLYGPVYFRLMTGHAPLTSGYADAVVETVMPGLAV